MQRRIIINADDFGLCEGVNKAVAQAHTNGVLTSTTIMTNMPAAESAIETAKKLPSLGVGVHLNLTEGRPISEKNAIAPLLDPDGNFYLSPAKIALFSLSQVKYRNAIKTELAAQIQWAIEKGLKPTHLDSHKHIHCFPVIFSIVCKLAERFNIQAIRWPFEQGQITQPHWPEPDKKSVKKAALIRLMARINHLQNSKFLKNKTFIGIAHTGKIDLDFLRAVSQYCLAEITELMTHPGLTDGIDTAKTRLVYQRQRELQALCDKRTKMYFNQAGIKLIHYGNI